MTSGVPDDHHNRRSVLLGLWLALGGSLSVLAFAVSGDGGTDGDPIYEWSTFAGGVLQYVVLVALTAGIAAVLPGVPGTLGLRRFERRFVGHAAGVVVASAILSVVLEPILHAGEEQGLAPTEYRADRLGPLIANSVLFVVIGPFGEELFFRGLGVTALRPLGVPVALAGTALVFGLTHGLLVALPALVFLGLGLAWVRERSQSVWPGYIAHGAYNAIGIAVSLAGS